MGMDIAFPIPFCKVFNLWYGYESLWTMPSATLYDTGEIQGWTEGWGWGDLLIRGEPITSGCGRCLGGNEVTIYNDLYAISYMIFSTTVVKHIYLFKLMCFNLSHQGLGHPPPAPSTALPPTITPNRFSIIVQV